jgi:hypothetical protein
MSVILRIEHPVEDFDRWHQAFTDDPVGRERGGVRRYRVMRAVEDPLYVLIDLEFDAREQAEAFAARLRELWSRTKVMRDPRARIVEHVEERVVTSGDGRR